LIVDREELVTAWAGIDFHWLEVFVFASFGGMGTGFPAN
jgi:hypothetical protein